MKSILMVLVLLASIPSPLFAAEESSKFLTVKARLIKRVDERMTLFSKLKECLDQAMTSKELKQCSDKYAAEAKKQSTAFKTERKKITN